LRTGTAATGAGMLEEAFDCGAALAVELIPATPAMRSPAVAIPIAALVNVRMICVL
jgi:hypothetical protein